MDKDLKELLNIIKDQAAAIKELKRNVSLLMQNSCERKKNLYRIVCDTNPFYPTSDGKDPYTFTSDQEIHPGDVIRAYDDHYNMGAVTVVSRVYDANLHTFYLYCEPVEYLFDDYIFTDEYKKDIAEWIKNYKSKFVEGKEPNGSDVLNMIDVLTNHRTSINRQKVWNHTDKILSEMLGYEIKPLVMMPY